MAAVGSVVVSEVLCFIQNYVANLPKANTCILNVSSSFFTVDEISEAKRVLFEFAEAVHTDMPRCMQRRHGDNKRLLDLEDIINLWLQLDVAKVVFPTFVAANLSRIPSISPAEADVCALALNVSSLRQEVEALSSLKMSFAVMENKLQTVQDVVTKGLAAVATSDNGSGHSKSTVTVVPELERECPVMSQDLFDSFAIAASFKEGDTASNEFRVVSYAKPKKSKS